MEASTADWGLGPVHQESGPGGGQGARGVQQVVPIPAAPVSTRTRACSREAGIGPWEDKASQHMVKGESPTDLLKYSSITAPVLLNASCQNTHAPELPFATAQWVV